MGSGELEEWAAFHPVRGVAQLKRGDVPYMVGLQVLLSTPFAGWPN